MNISTRLLFSFRCQRFHNVRFLFQRIIEISDSFLYTILADCAELVSCFIFITLSTIQARMKLLFAIKYVPFSIINTMEHTNLSKVFVLPGGNFHATVVQKKRKIVRYCALRTRYRSAIHLDFEECCILCQKALPFY